MVVSCCADGCNNRFGERQGLGFYVFPAVSRAGRNGSGQLEAPRLEIFENVATILHQVSLQQAI